MGIHHSSSSHSLESQTSDQQSPQLIQLMEPLAGPPSQPAELESRQAEPTEAETRIQAEPLEPDFPETSVQQTFIDHVLIFWHKSASPLLSPLSTNLLREICTYFSLPQDPVLALLRPMSLHLFQFGLQSWSTPIALEREILVLEGTRWSVLADREQVFVCGGSESDANNAGAYKIHWRSAYLITATGKVTTVDCMLKGRSHHGLIQFERHMFVFGGTNAQRKSEKLLLFDSDSHWKALPAMAEGRERFTPCLVRELIYLCGYGSTRIEAYSPRRNCFSLLPFTLPSSGLRCALSDGDFLFVYLQDCVVQLEVLTGEMNITRIAEDWSGEVQSQPALNKAAHLVYCLGLDYCWSVHLRTGRVVRQFSLPQ